MYRDLKRFARSPAFMLAVGLIGFAAAVTIALTFH
jgi:hypothetical protein